MSTTHERLIASIPDLKERIKKHRAFYEGNEAAVRAQIVEPVLNLLGWNTLDPDDVQPNVSFDEGVPDYSLMKQGKPILYVEAKKLGLPVDEKEILAQLGRYAFGQGTRYGVITNGASWLLLRSFEENKALAERVVWQADIENDEPQSIARKLWTIAKENVEKIEVLVKKAQILEEIWIAVLNDPQRLIRALMPAVKL